MIAANLKQNNQSILLEHRVEFIANTLKENLHLDDPGSFFEMKEK